MTINGSQPDRNSAPSSKTVAQAIATFTTYIDGMAQTFQDNDFDAYASGVSLPMMLKTDGGPMVVTDMDSLREGFDAWVVMVDRHKIDHSVHNVRDAVWLADDQIAALYETSLMAGDTQVMPTFTTLMELKQVDDRWAAHAIVNGMKNITWPITSPIFLPDEYGKA